MAILEPASDANLRRCAARSHSVSFDGQLMASLRAQYARSGTRGVGRPPRAKAGLPFEGPTLRCDNCMMKRTTSSVKRVAAVIGLVLALGPILGAAPTAASDARETGEYVQSSGPAVAAQVSVDRQLTLTSCNELTDSVVRLYSAYFLRWPDQSGFEFWLNQYSGGVRNLDLISQFFSQSDEFRTLYGHLSNEQFVTLVYNNVMNRAPDAEGQAYWVSRLNAGMTRGTCYRLKFLAIPAL